MKYNYISFSLWGNKEIYTIGAVKNAELAKKIYKSWRVIVYYDNTVPEEIISRLRALGVILIDMTHSGIYGLFWRFTCADRTDSKYIIFRDTDSRLSIREKQAVDEWIKNDNILHVMRDHPAHIIPFGAENPSILGGMWGIRGGEIEMTKMIKEFCVGKEEYYGIDQAFLESVYKIFKYSMTVHDEFLEKKPFPVKRQGYRFVGERIDENGLAVGDDWKQIRKYNKEHQPFSLKKIIKLITKRFINGFC